MSRESYYLAAWRINRTAPVVLAVLLLVNVVLFALLAIRVYPRVDQVEREFLAVQKDTRRGGKGLTPLQAVEQGRRDLARFRGTLPASRNFADLLGDLYSLAARCNLEIGQVSYDPKELTEHEMLEYGLSFAVTGTYGEVKKFVHGLEEFPRLIVIEKVRLAATSSADRDDLVTIDLSLTTYFKHGGEKP